MLGPSLIAENDESSTAKPLHQNADIKVTTDASQKESEITTPAEDVDTFQCKK